MRLLLIFTLAILAFNGAVAENIAYGVKVVVIDAGHGGNDPGAADYGKVYEKDIVLQVALKFGKLIETQMPGVKVVYTRTTDTHLHPDKATDLQMRANIANKAGGDLFISIHANASKSPAARGTETLIMGETTQEQSRNEDAIYANNREELVDMSKEGGEAIVRAYIQNRQAAYGEYTMAMAHFMQQSYISAGLEQRKDPIKPKMLLVLYKTDMPGVLTEIGFMSNPQELAYMRSEKGQNEIAGSMLAALKNYSNYVLKIRSAASSESVASVQTPAPEAEKPVAVTESAPQEIVQPVRYAIQITASAQSISVSSAVFKAYRNKVKQYSSEGRFAYKYCVGEYETRSDAQKDLAEVRKHFPDAFVVAVRGGKIM